MARGRGNVPWAISIGSILIVVFGVAELFHGITPFSSYALGNALGVFLVGLAIGLIAQGAVRGIFSGVLAGIAGAFVVYIIFSLLEPSMQLQLFYVSYSGNSLFGSVISLCLNDAIFAGMGGLIAGFLRKNR